MWSSARRGFAGRGLVDSLARGSLWSLSLNVLGTAISFGNQILLARTLTVAEYGAYLYVLAGMNVALIFGRLEFDVAAVRFIGALTGNAQWAAVRGFLRRSRQIVTASSLGIGAVGAVLAWWLAPPALVRAYWVACALLPATALVLLHGAYLQGLRRVREAQTPNLLVRPVLLGVGVAAVAWLIGRPIDAAATLAINLGATTVALGVALWFLKGALPVEARTAAPVYETRLWVTTSGGFMLMSVAQLALAQQTDLIVVGSFIGTHLAGLYGAAAQLTALISFGTIAIMFVALPIISDLHARGRRAELQRLVLVLTAGNLAAALPVCIGVVAFGRVALGLYGPAYEGAYGVLLILSATNLISAVVGHLAGFLLTMTGHQKQALVAFVGAGLLNLALTSWMTPTFGAEGAATASAIATVVKSLVLVWWAWKYLGIRFVVLHRV